MENYLISKNTFEIAFQLMFYLLALMAALCALSIDNKQKISLKIGNYSAFGLIVFYIVLVGFRAYDVGTDTGNYYQFNWIDNYPPDSKSEMLFYWLINAIRELPGATFTVFLIVISFLFFAFLYKGFLLVSEYYRISVLFIFFSFMSLFFSLSLSINIIRQGLALAVLVYSYGLWSSNKQFKKIIPYLLVAFICHTTSIIPILFFICINYKFKNQRFSYFYILYFLGIVLAYLDLGILNVAPFLKGILGNNGRLGYLRSSGDAYVVGFKPQFVIFNTVFLFLFSFIYCQLKKINLDSNYNVLLKYYILTSFLFFMVFQIPYSDRIGLFSWISIPLLAAPAFSSSIKPRFKVPLVIFFISTFIFFQIYG